MKICMKIWAYDVKKNSLGDGILGLAGVVLPISRRSFLYKFQRRELGFYAEGLELEG